MSFIQHKNPLNKALNELIKDVISYEDKELDVKLVLLNVSKKSKNMYFQI